MEKVLTSPCKGMNCGCADGVSHSLECHAEHAAAIAGGYFVKAAQPPHAQPQAHDDAALAALGWQRISCPVCGADGARAAPAQPQAQTTSPDDIHSCGEFCDLPECVAAREAQAQGEPTLPPLPEGKAVVRGPVSAFKEPEYGTLVDFDCEGPLSHCPADGEELFTADQVLAYGAECVQSHREAIAEVTRRFEELKRHGVPYQVHNEAIAKKDAALLACVEALKLAMHWAGPAMERDMRSPSNSQWMVEKTQAQEDSIYAAITHANQVLEGGGK